MNSYWHWCWVCKGKGYYIEADPDTEEEHEFICIACDGKSGWYATEPHWTNEIRRTPGWCDEPQRGYIIASCGTTVLWTCTNCNGMITVQGDDPYDYSN